MQALAELDEDENPDDDDAIEIPSKDKYKGWTTLDQYIDFSENT